MWGQSAEFGTTYRSPPRPPSAGGELGCGWRAGWLSAKYSGWAAAASTLPRRPPLCLVVGYVSVYLDRWQMASPRGGEGMFVRQNKPPPGPSSTPIPPPLLPEKDPRFSNVNPHAKRLNLPPPSPPSPFPPSLLRLPSPRLLLVGGARGHRGDSEEKKKEGAVMVVVRDARIHRNNILPPPAPPTPGLEEKKKKL